MKLKQRIKDSLNAILHTQLPIPLANLRFKRFITAIIVLIVSIATAIITMHVTSLTLAIISVYFAISGFKMSYDYANNKIIEYEMLCLASTPKGNAYTVVFEADDLETDVFVHNSKRKDFMEDVKYRFYTHLSSPKVILAYEQI